MKKVSVRDVFTWLHKGKPAVSDESLEDVAEAESNAIGNAVLSKPNVTVISANGSQKIYIRDVEYNLKVTKPAHGVGVPELKRSLERNREMLEKNADKMMAIYRHFKTNLDPMVVEHEGAYRTATKNALVARANIDVLIPLINIKGGDAEYEGDEEGLPIEEHIAQLRDDAEDMVDWEFGLGAPVEEESVNMQSVFIAGLIVVIVVMLLKVFL
ncbi:MAG: hypothetical protein ACPG47_11120 [Leucothrix sp.]